jgi:hypothetical protein
MKTLTLTRTERNADGTFGRLTAPDLSLYTCEDDWLDNAPGISCIPDGKYWLKRTIFLKHNLPTFEVTDVPGRSRILIHSGNTEEDVEGCILVGLVRGEIMVDRDEDTGASKVVKQAVLRSKEAHARFMEYLEDDNEAMLLIQWAPGLP